MYFSPETKARSEREDTQVAALLIPYSFPFLQWKKKSYVKVSAASIKTAETTMCYDNLYLISLIELSDQLQLILLTGLPLTEAFNYIFLVRLIYLNLLSL